VTYTYDGAHHVLSRTDAKGQRATYSYDSYGRLTQGPGGVSYTTTRHLTPRSSIRIPVWRTPGAGWHR